MREIFKRLLVKVTSSKFLMFLCILAVLCLVDLSPGNADVLITLVIAVFGANAAVHMAGALKRKEDDSNGEC